MVSEGNLSDAVLKPRPVLADVTNRPLKRPFSSISSDSPHKSLDDGDSRFAKQVRLGVQNLVKNKSELQFGADDALLQSQQNPCLNLPLCSASQDTSFQNVFSQNLNLPSNIREEQNLLGAGIFSALSEGEKSEGRIACGVAEGRALTQGFSNNVVQSVDGELCAVDKLASSNCGASELPTISASHEPKFLGLERCAELKGDAGGKDLLKTCSCSFCSKAAYIWSDLYYQDVKGRLSALRKSQKEASTVVQRLSGLKDTVVGDQQSSTGSSKLESTLMDQWKSLFVHMENTFAQESSQLESSFETLKNLRDNCKNNLQLTDDNHFDNH